jgi:diguanylate cyclase (GGDEF)-like protein
MRLLFRLLGRNCELDFSILDNIDIAAYVIDTDSHELLYVNKMGKELSISDAVLIEGYDNIHGDSKPGDFCSLKNRGEKNGSIWVTFSEKKNTYCYVLDKMVHHNGKQVKLSLVIDIADIDADFKNVLSSLQSEQSVMRCVKLLTSCDNLDQAIVLVLESILNFYAAARVFIGELDQEKGILNNIYEFCAQGVEPKKDHFTGISLRKLSKFLDMLEKNKAVCLSDENPSGDAQEILEQSGLKSIMAIPFYYNDALIGFLGVENAVLNQDNITYLKNLGYFVSNEMIKSRIHRKNEYLSYHDNLTGLCNRNYFNVFRNEFKERKPVNTGVIFADVNELKYINDTYGHECGDKELVHVAEIIKKNFPDDHIFRISGDEFVVICERIEQEKFLQKIDAMMNDFYVEDQESVTCGSFWTESYIDLDMAVNKADELLYVNKQEYHRRSKKSSERKPHMLQQLIEDIRNGKYVVYLQPISRSNDENIYYAEALIRYVDGKNILPPSTFIPSLEKGYIISNIDYFVLEEVCKKLSAWEAEGKREMRIAVNFSKITLMEHSFFEKVTSICRRHGTDVRKLVFEMPETTDTIDRLQMNELVQRLCALGFGVALDDFGKKYSSIDMLMSLDMDTLKLDRNIIAHICESEKSRIIVQYIIDIAHNIGMKCIAEGVETKEQQSLLREMQCDYIQGFVLGRPVAISEFEDIYLN